jgi:hypothetical protein
MNIKRYSPLESKSLLGHQSVLINPLASALSECMFKRYRATPVHPN